MNVFADYHHCGLYHALELLFEKRLGFNLFRPIGLSWAEKGYWQYSDDLSCQREYLDIIGCELKKEGYYIQYDNHEGITHKCLTFSQFQETPIDLIIATCGQHGVLYNKLRSDYKPKAKYIRLTGNANETVNWGIDRNLIDTTNSYDPPSSVNKVVVHQEFDESLFSFSPPSRVKKIKSYINLYANNKSYYTYLALKASLPEYQWFEHGHQNKDGFIESTAELAESMKDSLFISQLKSGGDGYGHTIHQAFALGRPVITYQSDYKGKMAYPLIIPGETAICMDNYTIQDSVKEIRRFTDFALYEMISENASRRFKNLVSFDEDERKIRAFLSNLL